jgi:hypothetical protein
MTGDKWQMIPPCVRREYLALFSFHQISIVKSDAQMRLKTYRDCVRGNNSLRRRNNAAARHEWSNIAKYSSFIVDSRDGIGFIRARL